ncbi:uncharacterized protein LOC117321585 [Pecten maximus]|uniref:uncharacterized protein LOC117321585 n=1 Tax=Pecten maximus TaxID=6579 RepID=UPI0014584A37|nr:uncharacterized protein LOC117321585 [Pecten maximus]
MSLIGLFIVIINGALPVLLSESTCNYLNIQPKARFYGFGLYYKPKQTITMCARECFLRLECLSITFNTTTKQCRTHTSDHINHPWNVLPSNDSSYAGIHSWTLTRGLEGCSTRPCPKQTRCIPIKNNNYTCIISECDFGVNIDYLTGWNWRPVGRTKTLKCRSNYYLNGTAITSTCLANGTWSYTDEIIAECLRIPETTTVEYNTTLPTNDSSTTDVPLNTSTVP